LCDLLERLFQREGRFVLAEAWRVGVQHEVQDGDQDDPDWLAEVDQGADCGVGAAPRGAAGELAPLARSPPP